MASYINGMVQPQMEVDAKVGGIASLAWGDSFFFMDREELVDYYKMKYAQLDKPKKNNGDEYECES